MNRVYRLVRHRTTGKIQVASELARGAGKSGQAGRRPSGAPDDARATAVRWGTAGALASALIGALGCAPVFAGSITGSDTTINGTTLALTGDETLGDNTIVTMTNGTLDFSGSNLSTSSGTQNLKDLTSDAASQVHLGGARINITGAGGGIFSGTLDSTGAALVTVSGGQWGLAGSVTTTLPFQIGANAQVNVYGNGTIANGVSIQSMGLLDISNTNTGFSTAFVSGAGAVALDSKTLTLTNGGDNSFAGRITGSGGVHLHNGTQSFTNQFGPVYSGNTVIDPGATLVLADAGALPLSAHVINNGTLSIAGTASNTAKIVSLAGNGSVTLDGSSSRALEITNGSDTFAGVISNPIAGSAGNVIISGGTQTLSGVNTYSGTTTVSNNATQATLALSGNGSIANSAWVDLSNGGIFDISQTAQGATVQQVVSNSVPGAGTVNLGNQTLTLSNPTASVFNFGGQIIGQQGGVTLQKGQMNLTYANTYQGDTTIDSGATVYLTQQGTLANSTVVANGTLDGSNTNLSNTAGNVVQVGGLAGSGTVTLGFNTLQINHAQNTVFDGQIQQTRNTGGANGFLVMNGGTQTFNNSVNLVSSMIVHQGATLKFGSQGSFSTPSGFNNDGTLDFSASSAQQSAGSITGIGSLILGAGGMTLTDANTAYGGVISGTGGLEFTQGQNILGIGASTYSGNTQIDSGASLALMQGGSLANSQVINQGVLDVSQNQSTALGGLQGSGALNVGSGDVHLTAAQGAFDGAINGSGGLVLDGGNWAFNSASSQSSGFAGNTTVNGGALMVGDAQHATAFLPGDVSVQSGGELRGHGTIGGNVHNSGSVFPGGSIGILHIAGNYTQAANGVLDAEIKPSAAPVAGVDYDQLDVGGTATLDGTLKVAVDSGNYTVGAHYDLVKAAGGVVGQFASVAYNPAFAAYLTPQLSYSGQTARLTLTPTAAPPQPTPTPALGLAYTTAQAAAQQAWSTQSSLFGMQQLLTEHGQQAIWLDAERAQGGANAAGVNHKTVAIGGQIATGADWTVGAAFAAGRNQTEDAAQQVDGSHLGLFGYGLYRQQHWRLDTQIGAGRLAQDSTRYLNPTGLVATGSTQGWYATAGATLRYHQTLGKAAFVEPYAGAAYLHTHTNGFTEQGAGLLNLAYGAQNINLGRFTAGVKTGLNLGTAGGVRLQPWVKLGAAAYAGDRQIAQSLTLGVLNQSLDGRVAPNAAVESGAGIRVSTADDRLSTTLAYQGEFSRQGHLNGLRLNVRYRW